MKLNPLAMSRAATYPARRGARPRPRPGLRALASAATVGAALCLSGCEGAIPFGGQVRLAGEPMPVSAFVCADSPPADAPALAVPGWYEVELCGTSTAWATFAVGDAARVQVEMAGSAANAVVDVVDAAGALVAQLDAETPTAELDVGPGRYVVSVTRADPDLENDWEWISLSLAILE
jgi:hypothetical protein